MLTLNKLQEIINKHDPVGLYPGAWTPDNEYDIEAKEVLLYNTQNNFVDFSDFVKNIFIKYFGEESIDKEKLENMAKEIYAISLSNK